MARIKVEDVLYHLDYDLKRALEATIKKHYPDVTVDRNRLYKTFLKEAYRKCSVWENVPDQLVEK
jgi:uncharacterized protein (DUF433 family)